METIKFNDKTNGEEIHIAYSDYGKGQPVVLIHGWPLSREMWEYQLEPLINAGHRVIKYDRRGFGKSSKPWNGYDYDTLTDDLHELMQQLDLNNAFLVGFSMGGGEVARYVGRYGESRLAGIALISAVTPVMKKTDSNPDGVDTKVFEEMEKGIREDRIGFLDEFGKTFFGVGFLSNPVSTPLLQYYRDLASKASARSTLECAKSFAGTDFTDDLNKVTVPTLIIHGNADKIVPLEASSKRTSELIKHAQMKIYDGAPHGLFYTHKDMLNDDLIHFIRGEKVEDEKMDPVNIPVPGIAPGVI